MSKSKIGQAKRLMLEAVIRALEDENQFRRYIISEKNGKEAVTEERLMEKYDVAEMSEMAKLIKTMEEQPRQRKASAQADWEVQETGLIILPEAAE